MTDRRVVWPAQGVVELEAFEVGEPGAGEVLLRTEHTLISPGTELAFLHALPNAGQGRYPQHPGYNHVGRVVAVGPGVERPALGERVVSSGGHASAVVTAAADTVAVPEGVSSRQAAYATMAAISLQAVRKARVELGEAALVLGQGIIGNLALQLARLSGAIPAVAVDRIDWRLEVAAQCGADLCVNPGDEGLDAVREALQRTTGRRGVDVVLEATGVPEAVHDALALAEDRGRVVLLASTRGVTEGVNFYSEIHRPGLVVIGAHNRIRPRHESTPGYWTTVDDWRTVLRVMGAGRLLVEPLTTDELAADDAARGYALLAEDRSSHMGVLLDWS